MKPGHDDRLIRFFIVQSNRIERYINRLFFSLLILLILSQILLQNSTFRIFMNKVERLEGEKHEITSSFICERDGW